MAVTLPISFASYLYQLGLFFVIHSVKMFSKQVLWIYVSVFLSLTLCTTRVCSQTTKEPPKEKGGKSMAQQIEGGMVKVLSMVTNRMTIIEKGMQGGNEKLKQMLVLIFTTVSKGPSNVVNEIIIIETTVYGKVTGALALALKNAGMQKQSMMVANFGKSMKTCYNDNKQNVFKTALVSIPTCIGEDTTTLTELATQDMNACQVIILDLEAFFQDLQKCKGMKCYRSMAMGLANQLRGDLMSLGKTRAKILMTAATLGPKTGACLGKKTGVTSVQEVVTVVKGFGSCVAQESKK